ncbi:MAG: hypothetical protein M0Z53_08445 [Thermaerobacter sp.]|nr:hypothetical protein [Thermaerobacter sp.]
MRLGKGREVAGRSTVPLVRNVPRLLMLMRTSFLFALVLGLGDMFGWFPMTKLLLVVHIVFGLEVLVAAALIAAVSRQPAAWIGVGVIVVAGVSSVFLVSSNITLGLSHLASMVIAVGLVEMAAARYKKTAG